jgi:hypothetical protein
LEYSLSTFDLPHDRMLPLDQSVYSGLRLRQRDIMENSHELGHQPVGTCENCGCVTEVRINVPSDVPDAAVIPDLI